MMKNDADWDVIIIGAGPAGLTAGIYVMRRGLRLLALEARFPGGRVVEAPLVENYPGFPEGISGDDLAKKMITQFERFGGKITFEEVTSLSLNDEIKTIITRRGKYTAKAVIIAVGAQRRLLLKLGEKKFIGRGVSYCALCDGPLFRGENVAVIGSEDEAFEDALFLTNIASKVFLVSKEMEPSATSLLIKKFEKKENTEILKGYDVVAIEGAQFVSSLKVKKLTDGEIRELQIKAAFIAVGVVPVTEIIKKAGVEADDRGFIKVDRRQKTNLDGVFAAGECTGGGMQISTTVGEGAMAAISAFKISNKDS